MKKTPLALIGPWPPPHGGISVHIKRLSQRLWDKGLDHTVYDDTGQHQLDRVVRLRGSWVNGFVLRKNPRIVHYHSHSWGTRMRLSAMTLKGTKVIFTVHSLRRLPSVPWHKRPEFGHMMRWCSFVAVNQDIGHQLRRLGARQVKVIGPYIKPLFSEKPSPEVLEFASRHKPVVAAAALLFKTWSQDQDMYGLFSLLRAFELFAKNHPGAGLVLYLSQQGETELFNRFKRLLSQAHLKKRVLLRLDAPEEFHTCLSVVDLFVRPSFADGMSMALSEALDAGVACVASDAVVRQKSALLFRAGDHQDMHRAMEQALEGSGPRAGQQDSFDALWELYQSLL